MTTGVIQWGCSDCVAETMENQEWKNLLAEDRGAGVAEGEGSAAESRVPLMPGEAGGVGGEAELGPCARQEGHGHPSRVTDTKKRATRLDMAESLQTMRARQGCKPRKNSLKQFESIKQYDFVRVGGRSPEGTRSRGCSLRTACTLGQAISTRGMGDDAVSEPTGESIRLL